MAYHFRSHVRVFVNALIERHNNANVFKSSLRDFLIELKEFSATDNADLFLEEKELESQQSLEYKQQTALSVPGMLKPDQMEDKEDEV